MGFENQFIAKQLSNNDLMARLGKLIQSERKIMHLILECIAEIDSRKLYAEKAYPSLFEFLVKEYGYSPSAAVRRIESARLLHEVPEVSMKIESGALNLSQLSQLQQAARLVQKTENRKVAPAEKRELLSKMEHTTQAKTEQILAQELDLPIVSQNKETTHRDESVTLTVTFSKEQMILLEQVRDLASHSVPEKKWAEVITYLAQKEVQRRTAQKEVQRQTVIRRHKKNQFPPQKATDEFQFSQGSSLHCAAPVTVAQTGVQKFINSQKGTVSSYIRKPLRPGLKKSILREQPCCQYQDPISGRVCASRRFLQIDHIQSVSTGGTNKRENLQVLCGQHNRLKYQMEMSAQL